MKNLPFGLLLLMLFACNTDKLDSKVDLIDKFMQGQADFFSFNGNILIAEKGKVIYQKSFGLSDFAKKQPLNDSTIFELASVSKQFTAMGILLLEKGGKLSLSDSVRKFFPELPYSNITLHHMLTHTSGLPEYEPLFQNKWDHSKIAFNKDVIFLLANEKPSILFKPGQHYRYSNTAYVLLASVIEKVSGMSFKNFMAKNVFEPLAMNHSRIYNTRRSGELITNYAYGYVWSDSLNKYVLPDSITALNFVYYLDGIQGDGITNSTTTDLLKWDRAIVSKKLLGEGTEKMVSPQVLADSSVNAYYGYGIGIRKDEFGRYIAHSGGWPGYSTHLRRYLEADKTIIVLSNNGAPSDLISVAIANTAFGENVEMPYVHKPIETDTSTLDLFTGGFMINGSEFNISRSNDSLFQIFKSGFRRHLIPESTTKVFYDNPKLDIQFEIVEQPEGASKYYRIQYGVRQELKKIK